MARTAEVFEFRGGDTVAVVQAMDEMSAAQQGWLNLRPGVRAEDAPPPPSVLGRVFTGTGPPVPVCTWVAPQPAQKPPHAEIGILHKTGPKVAARLASAGHAVPDRWVVLADHPKRGLVVAVHPEARAVDVVDWLLEAGRLLTLVPLTGEWRVEIHR